MTVFFVLALGSCLDFNTNGGKTLPSGTARVEEFPRELLEAELALEWNRERENKELLVQLDSSADYGLALYRTSEYRQRVIQFYVEETGSQDIAMTILENAHANDIPLSLAFSLAWMESRYNPEAVNHNSSSVDRGLFQLNNRSFPEMTEEEFFNPFINAEKGLDYLRWCLDAGDTEIVALAMYNAGRTRVSQGGTPLMTLEYISRILEYREDLDDRFYALWVKETNAKTARKSKAGNVLVIDRKGAIK